MRERERKKVPRHFNKTHLCLGGRDGETLLELIMFIVSFDVINCEKCNFHISTQNAETHLNMIFQPFADGACGKGKEIIIEIEI